MSCIIPQTSAIQHLEDNETNDKLSKQVATCELLEECVFKYYIYKNGEQRQEELNSCCTKERATELMLSSSLLKLGN